MSMVAGFTPFYRLLRPFLSGYKDFSESALLWV